MQGLFFRLDRERGGGGGLVVPPIPWIPAPESVVEIWDIKYYPHAAHFLIINWHFVKDFYIKDNKISLQRKGLVRLMLAHCKLIGRNR